MLNLHMNYYYLGISLEPDLEKALRRESLNKVEQSAELRLPASRANYMTCWYHSNSSIAFFSLENSY